MNSFSNSITLSLVNGRKVIDPAFLWPPPLTKAEGSFLSMNAIRSWTEKFASSVALKVMAVPMSPAVTRLARFFSSLA